MAESSSGGNPRSSSIHAAPAEEGPTDVVAGEPPARAPQQHVQTDRDAHPQAEGPRSGSRSSGSGMSSSLFPSLPDAASGQVLEQGTRIERYIVLKPIGRGGMGVVYAAYDPDLDRKVALKVLRPDKGDAEGPAGRAALLREAQAMARVSHPNVITVHDVGSFGAQVFVAMEFIQGVNLHEWVKQDRKRPWQEVLRVFLEAGRGLAAAHKAGLVHRDFKPANVLVGSGGRVYVTDFGLARLAPVAQAEAEEAARGGEVEEPVSTGSLDELPTETGLVMGTPQYMPPEQYLGTPVDPRADQFSFCASLYWALYRKRPFEPKKVARAAAEASQSAKKSSGGTDEIWRLLPHGNVVHEPPKDSKVPAWVRRALLRGLELHPEERFPSLEALLKELSQEQRHVRRRSALAVAGLMGLAAAGVGGVLYRQSQVCAGSEELVASAWGPSVRQKLEAAFTASGRPFAADSARRVAGLLDGYANAWALQHTQACEATRVHGTQTESLLSLRMVCLERRRQDLGALAGLLAEADAKLVDRSVDAAGALPALEPCQDIASLTEQTPLPSDPARRATLARLGEQVAQVKALNAAGRYKPALELAQKLYPEVAATAWLPLQAELRYHHGWMQLQTGAVEAGILELEKAFDDAETSRSDRLRMETLIRLVYALSNNGRAEEAQQWGQRGTALLARLGGEPRLAVDLLGNLGTLALMQGEYKEASESYDKARGLLASLGPDDVRHSKVIFSLGLAALRMGEYPRAIELIRKSLQLTEADKGKLHPEVAMRHTMLATTYRESGELDKALSHAQTALEIRKTTLGPEHPMVAESLDELGMILIGLKRYDEALASSQSAVELKNKALGPDHPDLSYSYDGIGQALLARGSAAEAVEPLRKALTYTEVEPEALAQTGFALAKALWAVGQEPVRAREVAMEARERYVKLEKPEQVAEIDAWLGSHQEVPVPAPVKSVKGVKKKKERTPKRRRL